MKTHGLAPTLAALAASFIAAGGARAAAPLSDAELAEIRGQEGSIVLPGLPAGGESAHGLAALAAAFADARGMSTLDATQFASTLVEAGLGVAMMPGYDGQTVKQYRISMAPVTFSFGAADLLKAGTGLAYSGVSMGTFTMTDFDATGTTVWSWTRH
jgi:hypothetical protein